MYLVREGVLKSNTYIGKCTSKVSVVLKPWLLSFRDKLRVFSILAFVLVARESISTHSNVRGLRLTSAED